MRFQRFEKFAVRTSDSQEAVVRDLRLEHNDHGNGGNLKV